MLWLLNEGGHCDSPNRFTMYEFYDYTRMCILMVAMKFYSGVEFKCVYFNEEGHIGF